MNSKEQPKNWVCSCPEMYIYSKAENPTCPYCQEIWLKVVETKRKKYKELHEKWATMYKLGMSCGEIAEDQKTLRQNVYSSLKAMGIYTFIRKKDRPKDGLSL